MRLFGSCLLCFGLAVSVNAQSPDYTQQLIGLQNELNLINNHIGNLDVLTESNFDYEMNWLTDIMLGPRDPYTGGRQSVTSTRNIVSLLQSINSGIRQSGDILAGNPWWGTNSAFALTLYNYNRVYPSESPDTVGTFSFPQFVSKWSSILTVPAGSAGPISDVRQKWFNTYFGYLRRGSFDQANPYTWFDWMTDAMRSNLVVLAQLSSLSAISNALTTSSYSTLTQELSQELGSSSYTDPEYTTNALPEYEDLVEYADTSDAESAMDDAQSAMNSRIEALSGMVDGSYNSELVVIPQFSVGGISVQRRTFDFADNDVVRFARPLMRFLWGVMLFASLFALASTEFAYYANLGRTWTRSEMIQAKWEDSQ